jgi:hypothetical protein
MMRTSSPVAGARRAGIRHFGTSSTAKAAFYNDGPVLDTPLVRVTPDERAAALRVLARHDALDLAEVLGLAIPSAMQQGAAA